jgi:ABC-2 type transport system permease protein
MIDLVAAELLKLRTTRTFWLLAGGALAVTAMFTVASLASDSPSSEDDARSLITTIGIGGLLMLLLGIISSAGEYRHGTITSTFLVAPDRTRVLLGKLMAITIAALLVATLSTVVLLAIALPWLSADGNSLGSHGVGAVDVAGILASSTAYIAISALLGVALGALLTNQIGAIAVVPVLLIVVDPLLSLLVNGYDTYSLGGLWAALGDESSEDAGFEVLAPATAAVVYLGYTAAVATVAAVIGQRRDVS